MPNLVPIPANAFSGGAVKLDNGPIDRMLLQNTFYKQQASQLALNKYFDKQANQLSPTGMDMQNDGQGFIDRKNAWQDYALANRRAIVNPSLDGGKAAAHSNALFNEAKSFAQQSVQKVKQSQEAAKIFLDPTKSGLLTDHARDLIHHGTLGLDDPEYVPLDLSATAFNPKPWGTQDEAGLSNEVAKVKGTSTDRSPVQNAKTGMQTVTTDTGFSKDDLTGMYSSGAQRYYSNPGFKAMIDAIPHNPLQFQDLNGLFKNHFGHDVQSGEDLAAAYALSKNPNSRSVDKSTPIPSYSNIAQEKKKEVAAMTSGVTLNREKQLEDYKQDKKQASAPDSEGLLQTIEKTAATTPNNNVKYSVNGQSKDGYVVEKNPKLASQFEEEVSGHKHSPDQILYDPKSQTYTGLWFERDSEGKPVVAANGTHPISRVIPPKPLSRESVKAGMDQGYLPKAQAGKALPKTQSGGKRPPLDSFIKK